MSQIGPSRGERFAVALRLAIHDVELERAGSSVANEGNLPLGDEIQRLVHYWDTDSLFWPALGFMAGQRRGVTHPWSEPVHGTRLQNSRDDDRLASALLSAGFLGSVNQVRAHRLEFSSVLVQFARSRRRDPKTYRQSLRAFVQEHDLDAVMGDLVHAAASLQEGTVNADDARNAIVRLNMIDRRTFCLVESLAGTWQSRVGKLMDPDGGLLATEEDGPRVEEIYESNHLELFWRELLRIRDDDSRTNQTAVDAVALTAIAVQNERASKRRARVLPRFHTATPAIWQLISESAEANAALSCNYLAWNGVVKSESILRDSYSYILRAMFPSLAPLGARIPPATHGPAFDELKELCHALEEALDTGEEELRALVEKRVLGGGERVDDVIRNLESSAMGTIWLRYSQRIESDLVVPPGLQGIADGLKAIFKIGSIKETRKIAYEFLDSSERTLRLRATDLALQAQMTDRISRGWPAARSDGEVSLASDLAAIRWGIQPTEEDDQVYSIRERFLVSDIEQLRQNPRRAERAMAILVALRAFDLARRLRHALGDAAQPVSDSIELMTLASEVMTLQSSEVDRVVVSLLSFFDVLATEEKTRLSLGFGYVLFNAWRRAGFALGRRWGSEVPNLVLERWPEDPRGWALRSHSVVEDTLSFEPGLLRAFQLNHLTYVGVVTGLDDGTGGHYASELERLAVGDWRQGRFLDTIAYRRYLLALRALPSDRSGAKLLEWRELHADPLRVAAALLREAIMLRPNDQEIEEHRRRVVALCGLND